MSEALKLARKSRQETIQQTADRIGVSVSSIRRMESRDADLLAGIGVGALLSALCNFGFTTALADALRPEIDTHGDYLRRRMVLQRPTR